MARAGDGPNGSWSQMEGLSLKFRPPHFQRLNGDVRGDKAYVAELRSMVGSLGETIVDFAE